MRKTIIILLILFPILFQSCEITDEDECRPEIVDVVYFNDMSGSLIPYRSNTVYIDDPVVIGIYIETEYEIEKLSIDETEIDNDSYSCEEGRILLPKTYTEEGWIVYMISVEDSHGNKSDILITSVNVL